MSCPEEFELFELREGGLDENRAQEVAGHGATCAECQATLAELEALGAALAAPEPMSPSDRAAFVAGVVQKVDQAEGAMPRPHQTRSRWAFAVPIAAAAGCAALALIVVPTFFLTMRSAEAPVAMDMAAGQPPAAESMDHGIVQFAEDAESANVERSASADRSAPPPPPSAATPTPSGGGGGAAGSALRRSSGIASATSGAKRGSRGRRPMGKRHRGEEGQMGRQRPRAAPGSYGTEADSLMLGTASSAPTAPGATFGSGAGGLRGGRGPVTKSLGGGTSGRYQRAPATPQPTALDPNGRFATTYRPGRGHLARFESTLLRGRAPEAAVALVGDVGRGSGPTVDAPAEKAIGLHIATELRQADPGGGPCHLAITLRSSDRRPTGRPDIAVHLVMDTSGSMSGAAIDQARAAAAALVSMLEPGDRFSLTSYNSDASLVVPEGPVGARRTGILGMIGRIRAGGGTNLEAGLRMGYDQARSSRAGRDSVQLVIVLSDGRANQGITDPWALSEMAAAAFQSGFETTSIGVGDNYDPMVMSTLADYGAGGYYYLPDASAIEGVIRAELDVRSQPVARGVELRVRLANGVELLQAYGSRRLNELEASRVRATEVAIDHSAAHRDGIARDRQEDREGGMRFFIPGFARDDQHTILLRLRLPPGSNGSELSVADLELRYKDRILGRNGGEERRVAVTYAPNRAAAMATQDRDVRRAVLSFRTGEALSRVATHIAAGEQPRALAILHERSALLQGAAEQLDDATLRAEAHRLDAFRAMLASQGIGNRLMLGAIVQRASSGMMR